MHWILTVLHIDRTEMQCAYCTESFFGWEENRTSLYLTAFQTRFDCKTLNNGRRLFGHCTISWFNKQSEPDVAWLALCRVLQLFGVFCRFQNKQWIENAKRLHMCHWHGYRIMRLSVGLMIHLSSGLWLIHPGYHRKHHKKDDRSLTVSRFC